MALNRQEEQLLKQAATTIDDLRARLAAYEASPLSKAVQSAVERPSQGDLGRNKFVTAAVKKDIFTTDRVTKSRESAKDKRTQNRRELEKARGLRPSKYDRRKP